MRLIKSQIAFEKKTVGAMTRIYCRVAHRSAAPCPECQALLDYAHQRLTLCRYQEEKPTCLKCAIHCYRPDMKEKIKMMMRRAGPRMIFRHPWLTAVHFWKEHLNSNPPRPAFPRR